MKEAEKRDIRRFSYDLPEERIAQFPLEKRDESKLLVCCNGVITGDRFFNIDKQIPEGSLMVFNDTRVIHARLHFHKAGGAVIEIFCLEPLEPKDYQAAFGVQNGCRWKCLVGNLKRWKSDKLIREIRTNEGTITLSAVRMEDLSDGCHAISFEWDPPHLPFSDILLAFGMVPLPPYIHRPADQSDENRYQTIYAENNGSVAAPTAGLHFTPEVMKRLSCNGVLFEKVTLHVGLGTFRPVMVSDISEHVMHAEKIVVTRKTIETLLEDPGRPVIAVGTTAARTLESLYWLGIKVINDKDNLNPEVDQWYPYLADHDPGISLQQSLKALLYFLRKHNREVYSGTTSLMIIPGYRYRVVSGLITNFHMPQSTLLMLVAAMVGDDWEKAYRYAMDHGFRFLSYGDSSLFIKNLT